MAVEIPTIARVFLADPVLARHSAHHTIYYGEGDLTDKDAPLYKLEVVGGVRRGLDAQTYGRLHALGTYLTTDRPKARGEEND